MFVGVGALAFSGCSPCYVLRSGYEEARILWRRQPIAALLQDPAVDAETKAKLALALDVRTFAREALGLRVAGSFSSFARVDADQVVHVVLAARRDRLEFVTWWFPIVGRVPYRGFFDEPRAQRAAAALEADGYDTIVQASVAFSTLGWFDDPMLSNLLRFDRVGLADVIIHELTHNTRYVPGQTGFNESFANFVGLRGALAFLAARGDADGMHRAQQSWQDALAFSKFLGGVTARLRTAYVAGVGEAERQRLFEQIQTEFRNLPLQTNQYASFGGTALNNARLLHDLLYYDRLALFDRVLGRYRGDLRVTISAVLNAVASSVDPYAAVGEQIDGETGGG